MSFERFIAQRFMPRRKSEGGFSGPLSLVAVASIALGVTVMVMAVSILHGFQTDIANKVVGFGSHITLTSYAPGIYQEPPIHTDSTLEHRLTQVPGVHHLQPFATKGGMAKTDNQIQGIILRGMNHQCDTSFFATNLIDGRLPQFDSSPTTDIIISSLMANKLQLSLGDKLRCYFWQADSPRARAFTICGIYNTDLTEFDELYLVGDLRQVQRLNDWDSATIGGYELLVDDFNHLETTAERVRSIIPYDLNCTTITQANPALFAWLDLLNSNITLILTIMSLVCAIAIISALLIMIFEKSATIGMLKALGANNRSIRHIFLIKAGRLILEGIAIGDLLAFALCQIQLHWTPIKLDPESYSMSHVPIALEPATFLIISLATLIICLLALLLPAAYISRIHPATTIKIEQ